jgi:hypothetical protein
MGDEWTPADFARRGYYIEDDREPDKKGELKPGQLEKARLMQVVFYIDGKKFAQMEVREPGMLAVVSKPNEEGIRLEVVQPGGVRFTDHMTPEETAAQTLLPWHKNAVLGDD